MSYEGRSVYICGNGHIHEVGCYDDKPKENCFCGEKLKYVGGVDDTNGDSVALFRKILKTPRKVLIDNEYDKETGSITIKYIPATYEIEKCDGDIKCFNYDTGEDYMFQ